MAEQYKLQGSRDGKMRLDVSIPMRLQLYDVAAIVWTAEYLITEADVRHFLESNTTRFAVMQSVKKELKWNGLESILNAVGEIEDEEPFQILLNGLKILWSKW